MRRVALAGLAAACAACSAPRATGRVTSAPWCAARPPLAPMRAPALVDATTVTLDNGLMLAVAPRGAGGELRASLVLRRAGDGGDPRRASLARATFVTMLRGFAAASDQALRARAPAGVDASYSRVVTTNIGAPDVWTWTVTAPPEALVDVLFAFARSVRGLAPTDEDAARASESSAAPLISPRFEPFHERWTAQLQRDTREAEGLLGIAASSPDEPVDRAAMAAWARARYVPRATAVVVQGPVRAEAARAYVEHFFGDWRGPEPPPLTSTAPAPSPLRAVLVPTSARARASLTLFARAPVEFGEGRAVAMVLQAALSSRVLGALRRERAAIYSPVHGLFATPTSGVGWHVEVEPARALDAARCLCDLARDLAARGLDADEFEGARRTALTSFAEAPGTPEGLHQALIDAAGEGRAAEREPDPTVASLVALDLATINTRITRALRPEHTQIIVRGAPAETPLDALEGAVGGRARVAPPEVPLVPVAAP